MQDKANIDKIRYELVEIASSMLAGKVHVISGIRQLNKLRLQFDKDERESPLFHLVIGIDSDTHMFPLEDEPELRSKVSPERLGETDAEIEDTIAFYKEDILKTCHLIVEKYS
jgi:hypothetical protein